MEVGSRAFPSPWLRIAANRPRYGAPVDLNGYLDLLRRRWLPLAVATVATVVLSLLVTAAAPREYRASTRLFVNIPAAVDVREALQGVQLSAQLLESYAEIATSRSSADAIAARLGGKVSAGEVRSRLSAEPQPDTLLIDLVVLDEDRGRARETADAAAEVLTQSIKDLGPSPERSIEARIIDRAVVSADPVSPRPLRNLAAGLVLGLLAGVALAFAVEGLSAAPSPAAPSSPKAAPPSDQLAAIQQSLAELRTEVAALASARRRAPRAPKA